VSSADEDKLVIVGGGLAGSLAALALNRKRPEQPILLLESSERFGGNHLWSFFDPDVEPDFRWLVDPFIERSWESYDISFPARRRRLATGYSSASSDLLDRHVRSELEPHQFRLGASVAEVEHRRVTLFDGEKIEAKAVIDARGFDSLPDANRNALDLAWQKFVGREFRVSGGHGLERPVVMDAEVEQIDGYRFVYSLPFDPERLLIEDTYYSANSLLDTRGLAERIDAYRRERGWHEALLEREEKGVLPVALGGAFDLFWPEETVGRIGVRGGFFHPTTGYSLPDAVRCAFMLTRQPHFKGDELARILRAEAKRIWRERGFYRLLNRMLFRAAAPPERYKVLEHFYRLDEGVIGRFYAARSSQWDKFRILSGKPPVPIGQAVKAMLR
jgi:lycopene beta-cyclase